MSVENASRLYLWKPASHGPRFIGVVAASEAEARAAIESVFATMPAEDKACFEGWGLMPVNEAGYDVITGIYHGFRSHYTLSVHEAGQPFDLPYE